LAYDVIIVGARCAGSPLGMLLARAGRSILVVDRATFPSDCLSTHFIQPQGVGLLAKWGLVRRLLATRCPPLRGLKFNGPPGVNQDIEFPAPAIGLCPRRSIIDNILVEAAREAGAEVREGFSMQDLVHDANGRVAGISGRDAAGNTVTEEGSIVVGADGLHSRMAQLVDAPEYNRVETLVCAYFSYFAGFDQREMLELGDQPGSGFLCFPTHDNLTCIAAVRPVEDFAAYRADIEGTFAQTIATFGPEIASRVKATTRAERWYGTADVPHYFRKPYGLGWALVGDAGLHIDPTLGLGMSKAFSEADLLAPALIAALDEPSSFDAHLQRFHEQRDEAWLPEAQRNLETASRQARREPVQMQPCAGS
jgi:2-polyprenyl-6-methoxyphenol hydroxylase-like FAD-dependent oxidoreductase